MIELWGPLQHLAWLAGVEWPQGNEDEMWALGGDWRTAADELDDTVADIIEAKRASLHAYPEGDGVTEMIAAFDSLISGDGSDSDQSVPKLADYFRQLGTSAYDTGTEIEYTKLMYISSLVLLAAEIAAAWIFPPTAPAVQAAAVALTRFAVRILGQRVMQAIFRLVANKFVGFLLRHVAIDTILGTIQEVGIQAYQVEAGHRPDFDLGQIAVTVVSSAAGGAAAGPVGDIIGNKLQNEARGMGRQYLNGAITGTAAGFVGGLAGTAAAIPTQFAVIWADTGSWDQAMDQTMSTLPQQFGPLALVSGATNGLATGVNKVGANHAFSSLKVGVHSDSYRNTWGDRTFMDRLNDAVSGPGTRSGGLPTGTGAPAGADGTGGFGGDGSQTSSPARTPNGVGGSGEGNLSPAGNNGHNGDSPGGAGEAGGNDRGRSVGSGSNDGDDGPGTREGASSADGEGGRQDNSGAVAGQQGPLGDGEGGDGGSAQHGDTGPADRSDSTPGPADRSDSGAGVADRSDSGANATDGPDSGAGAADRSDPATGAADRSDSGTGVADRAESAGARDRTDSDGTGSPAADSGSSARQGRADDSGLAVGQQEAGGAGTGRTAGDAAAGPGESAGDRTRGETPGPVVGAPVAGPMGAATPPATATAPVSPGAPAAPGSTPGGAGPAAPGSTNTPGAASDSRAQAGPTGESRSSGASDGPRSRAGIGERSPYPGTDGSGVRAGRTGAPVPDATNARQVGERQDPAGGRIPGDVGDGRIGPEDVFPLPLPDSAARDGEAHPGSPDQRARDQGSPGARRDGGARPGDDGATRDRSTDDTEERGIPEPGEPQGAPDPRNRGECARLTLAQLAAETGSDRITPPEEPVGPRGMDRRQMEDALGGKLYDYPDPGPEHSRHQAVADELLRQAARTDPRLVAAGRGPRAFVVDEYAGPVDEHGVGSHAYSLTVRMDPLTGEYRVVVSDPAAGRRRGFPPDVPAELRYVSATLLDGAGRILPPSGHDGRVRPTVERYRRHSRSDYEVNRQRRETDAQYAARRDAEDADLRSLLERRRAEYLRAMAEQVGEDGPAELADRFRAGAAEADRAAEQHRSAADDRWDEARRKPEKRISDRPPDEDRTPSRDDEDAADRRGDEDVADRREDEDPADRREEDPAGRRDEDSAGRRDDQGAADRRDGEGPAGRRDDRDVADRREDEDPADRREEDPADRRDEDSAGRRDGDRDAAARRDGEGPADREEDSAGRRDEEDVADRREDPSGAVRGEPESGTDAGRYRYDAQPDEPRPYRPTDPGFAEALAATTALREAEQAQRDSVVAALRTLAVDLGLVEPGSRPDLRQLRPSRIGPRIDARQQRVRDDGTLSEYERARQLADLDTLRARSERYHRIVGRMSETSQLLGELGGLAFALDAELHPGAIQLTPYEGASTAKLVVDIAVLVPGTGTGAPKLLIVEAKGADSPLGGSRRADAQQGAPEYLRDTLAIDKNLATVLTETPDQMRARGIDPDGAAGRGLLRAREEMLAAHRDGTLEVEYHQVRTAATGEITVRRFDLERDGDPVRVDVIGGIDRTAPDGSGSADRGRSPGEGEARRNPDIGDTRRIPMVGDTRPEGDDAQPIAKNGDTRPISVVDDSRPTPIDDDTQPITRIDDTRPVPAVDDTQPDPIDGAERPSAARLLGAPNDDSWSGLDSAQVGARLRDEIRDLIGNPRFEVFGFDRPEVHPEVAREYARALVDMFRAHPYARLGAVVFRDLGPDVFGRTHWSLDNGVPRADSIEFNTSVATDPAAVRRETEHNVDTGWFPDVARDRPAYARAVHEFGHVLDGAGRHRARRDLTGHLMRHFFDRHPEATSVDDYFAWLRESLSGYSFHPGTPHPKPAEALAEAFLATEMRRAGAAEPGPAVRDRGDDPVRLIHNLLVESAWKTPRPRFGWFAEESAAPQPADGPAGPRTEGSDAGAPPGADPGGGEGSRSDGGPADPAAADAATAERERLDLVRTGDDQLDDWRYAPVDQAVQVREVLARTATGRAALALLRDAGVTVRFVEPGDGPVPADEFNGRTMAAVIVAGDRDQVARAAAVVRVAALAESVLRGRVEVTPARIRALDRADHVAARMRAEADALGRQAEFRRELGRAGYDTDNAMATDPVDLAQRRILDNAYLEAYDAAIRQAGDPQGSGARTRVETDPARDAELGRLAAVRDEIAASRDRAVAVRDVLLDRLGVGPEEVATRALLEETVERLYGRSVRVDRMSGYGERVEAVREAATQVLRRQRELELAEADMAAAAGLRDSTEPVAATDTDRLHRVGAAEGIARLLAHRAFDSAEVGTGRSGRAAAEAEWDAARAFRPPADMDEYIPSAQAAARDVEALVRADAAAAARLHRIEAAWGRAADRLRDLLGMRNDPGTGSRREILDHLARRARERSDSLPGLEARLLGALTDEHTRVSAERARLRVELTEVVARDLAGTAASDRIRVQLDDSGAVTVQRETGPVRAEQPVSPDSPVPHGDRTARAELARAVADLRDKAFGELSALGTRAGAWGTASWVRRTLDEHGVEIRFSTEPEATAARTPNTRRRLGVDAGYDPVTRTLTLHPGDTPAQHVRELVVAARLAEQFAGIDVAAERMTLPRDEYCALMLDRVAEAYALSFRDTVDLQVRIVRPAPTDPLARSYAEAFVKGFRTAESAYGSGKMLGGESGWFYSAGHKAGFRAVRAALDSQGPLVGGLAPGEHFAGIWDRAHGISPTGGTEPPTPRRIPADTPEDRLRRARSLADEIEGLQILRDLGQYVPEGPAEQVYRAAHDRELGRARRRAGGAETPAQSARRAGTEALSRYLRRTGLADAEVAMDVVRSIVDGGGSPWGHPKEQSEHRGGAGTARPETMASETDSDTARRVVDAEMERFRQPERMGERPGRLSDRVLRYLDPHPRLVVTARPGEHVDALRELALTHPEYGDVLWDHSHGLDYRQVTVGPDGEPVVTPVNRATAEGPYGRRDLLGERDQMLAHYLRFRAEGRTDLGFTDWLKQLGPDAFYTKADRGSTHRPGTVGHLRNDFVTRGHQRVLAADRPLDPTHPARIAHNLYTRQVPIAAGGSARPGHHRLEVFAYGAGHLSVFVEPDGHGGWRVPAPVGLEGSQNTLSRYFQGMAGDTREGLVERITRILDDPAAPLTPESRPRGRIGRLLGRLPFGSDRPGGNPTRAGDADGTPPPDGPEFMGGADTRPHGNRTGEPGPDTPANPPDPAADAALLHAPTDEWSALEPVEVGLRLREVMRELTGDPDFEVYGFGLPDLNPTVVQEFARSLIDMYRRYPQVDLCSAGIGHLDDAIALNKPVTDRETGIARADSIALDYTHARSAERILDRIRQSVDDGRLNPNALRRPVYAVGVHEFGHGVDYAGGRHARRELETILREYHRDIVGGDTADFAGWLRRELVGYSFRPDGRLHEAEALAEAFAEVELARQLPAGRRPEVGEVRRRIHDLLVGYADADPGVPAQRIGPLHDGPEHIGTDDMRSADSGDRYRDAVADEWSAMGLDEIVATLRERYPFREITGFADRPGVPPLDLTLVREVARAVDLMTSRFPMLDVHNLHIGPVTDPDHVRGLAGYDLDPRDADRMVTDTITLNERLLRNPGEFYASRRRSEQTFHSPRNSADRPAFATTVHELGHGLDYAGSTRARGTVEDLLVEYYSEKTGGFDPDEFSVWINQLSGYSFTNRGDLNRPEVLADAVLDVVLNGPDATEPARIVYAALLRESIDNYYDTFENEAAALRITDLGLGPWMDGYDRTAAAGPDRPTGEVADRSDDSGTPDSDIALLGAPAADQWSDLGPAEIGEKLRDHMRAATGNPDFAVFGFDQADLNPEVVREYARAVTDMYRDYPHTDIRAIGIGNRREGILADAGPALDRETGLVHTEDITLNYRHATSVENFRAQVQRRVDNEQFSPTMLRRPVYAMAVHEYGHALDYAGGLRASSTAQRHLLLRAAEVGGDFGAWLRQLSGYSRDDDGLLRGHEAVPDAFAEYIMGGDDPAARDRVVITPVRELYELLIRHADNPPGGASERSGDRGAMDAGHRPGDDGTGRVRPDDQDGNGLDRDGPETSTGGGAKKPPGGPPRPAPPPEESDGGRPDQEPGGDEAPIHPDAIIEPLVIEVDGERIAFDLVPDGPDRWRLVPQGDLPSATPERLAALRREIAAIRRMWPGRAAQVKYPSGSGWDSRGQAAIADGVAGIPDLVNPVPPQPPATPAPTPDHPVIGPAPESGPADPTLLRIGQQLPVWIGNREHIPIFGRLSARMRDDAGEFVPVHPGDDAEYQPWLTDGTLAAARDQLLADLDSRRISPAQALRDLLAVAARPDATPEQQRQILDALRDRGLLSGDEAAALADGLAEERAARGSELPVGPAPEGESLTDAARRLLDIDLPDDSPETLARVIDEQQYRVARATGAIEGLAAAVRRYRIEQTLPYTMRDAPPAADTERGLPRAGDPAALDDPGGRRTEDDPGDVFDDERFEDETDAPSSRRPGRYAAPDPEGRPVPFRDEISFIDQNPMGRFLIEILAAFGHEPGLLDTPPVENGADQLPMWGDGYELGRDQGLRRFFENALRRDQIRDELASWAAMRDLSLEDLLADPEGVLDRLRTENVARSERVAEFVDAARATLPETGLTDPVGDLLGRQLVRLPGGAGQPDRLVIVDGARDREQVLADALAADSELRHLLDRGDLVLDYRAVQRDWTGETVLVPAPIPPLRYLHENILGRDLEVLLVRDGDGTWHQVTGSAAEHRAALGEPLPRSIPEIAAEIAGILHELGIGPDAVAPDVSAGTVGDLLLDNAVRAVQLEALADFIRSATDIEIFNELTDARSRLARRLGLNLIPDPGAPERTFTAESLADRLTDTGQRRALRAQQFGDLAEYAKGLREVDPDAVAAARDRLARRLVSEELARKMSTQRAADRAGVDRRTAALLPPGYVDGPDGKRVFAVNPSGLDPKKLFQVIRRLERDGQGELVHEALAEYANALFDIDPYTDVPRGDRTADPRIADGRFPMHDREAMGGLRDLIAEAVRAVGADDFARAVADAANRPGSHRIPDDDPDRRPNADRDWARLVGVDLTGADDATFVRIYEAYRDGRIENHEGLSPEDLAAELGRLRREVRDRARRIAALGRLLDEYARGRRPDLAAAADGRLATGAGDPPPAGPGPEGPGPEGPLLGPAGPGPQGPLLGPEGPGPQGPPPGSQGPLSGSEGSLAPRTGDETPPPGPEAGDSGDGSGKPPDTPPAVPGDPGEGPDDSGPRAESGPGAAPALPDSYTELMDWVELRRAEIAVDAAADEAAWARRQAADRPGDGLLRFRAEQADRMLGYARERIDRIRLAQVDRAAWNARMDADRARFLADMDPDNWLAGQRADLAEWVARMAAERARWWQDMLGGPGGGTPPGPPPGEPGPDSDSGPTGPKPDSAPDPEGAPEPDSGESVDKAVAPGDPERGETGSAAEDGTPAAGNPADKGRPEDSADGVRTDDSPDGGRSDDSVVPVGEDAEPVAEDRTPEVGGREPEAKAGISRGDGTEAAGVQPETDGNLQISEGAAPVPEGGRSAADGAEPDDPGGPRAREEDGGATGPRPHDLLADALVDAVARCDDLTARIAELASGLRADVDPGAFDTARMAETLAELRGHDLDAEDRVRVEEIGDLLTRLLHAEQEVRRITGRIEYDRLVGERHGVTREREFLRAKITDRARNLGLQNPGGWADLGPEARERIVLRLDEETGYDAVDVAGGIDEMPLHDRSAVGDQERQHRRDLIRKLIARTAEFDELGSRLRELDRQIAGMEQGQEVLDRPRPEEVTAELERLARERAAELHRIKPRRTMRDDLARRLGPVDENDDPAAGLLEPGALDATLRDLREGAYRELAAGVLRPSQYQRRLLRIDALADAARDVNEAHHRIGRLQDDMARVAGVWRALVEAEGGRMVTDRVGVVDGDAPRIIVFGPRPDPANPRADHDAALDHALRNSLAAAQAMVRPETTVEYRRVLADRADNWRVEDMDPPEVERMSTGWVAGRRLDMTRWRDAAGDWHPVDPTRPGWQTNRDAPDLPMMFGRKDLPDGVSGWASEDVVNDIVLPLEDVPAGKIPESALPLNAPMAPAQYDTSGIDPKDLFGQHWGADAYNVMRLLLMAALVPKHPAVKAWIQRHPEIGRWVQARPWLQKLPPFGTVFRGYEWFAPPGTDVQPMHRRWQESDHLPRAAMNEIPEGLRREWEREADQWAEVQRWADEEYDRFLGDDTDIDRIADGIERYREDRQRAAAREFVDLVRTRTVGELGGLDPLGNVPAQLARIEATIDRMAEEAGDRFAVDDPELVRNTVEQVREMLLGVVDPAEIVPGADPDEIVRAVHPDDIAEQLAGQMRDDVPRFTRAELEQIKNHLMVDEHRVRDADDPDGELVRRPMDRLADIAEAWHRLRAGEPLPADLVLLQDALAEAQYLADHPQATWQAANTYAIGLGHHWDSQRPPLTGWRAGRPYALPPLQPDAAYLPPGSRETSERRPPAARDGDTLEFPAAEPPGDGPARPAPETPDGESVGSPGVRAARDGDTLEFPAGEGAGEGENSVHQAPGGRRGEAGESPVEGTGGGSATSRRPTPPENTAPDAPSGSVPDDPDNPDGPPPDEPGGTPPANGPGGGKPPSHPPSSAHSAPEPPRGSGPPPPPNDSGSLNGRGGPGDSGGLNGRGGPGDSGGLNGRGGPGDSGGLNGRGGPG
ncbi:hypothetical protein, partial [Nocardia rhamnosiphila]